MAFHASPSTSEAGQILFSVLDSDAVQKHQQAKRAHHAGGRRFRRDGADKQAGERIAPAPKEKPNIETWPSAYPAPIARKRANNGWASRKAVIVVYTVFVPVRRPILPTTPRFLTGVAAQIPKPGDRRRQQFG